MRRSLGLLALWALLASPSAAFIYPDESLDPRVPERTGLEIPFEAGNEYPHYFKQIAQSMDTHEANSLAYLTYTLHVSEPGFKKWKVTGKLVDGNIIPVKYFVWKKDFPIETKRPLDLYISDNYYFFTLLMPDGTLGLTYDGRMFTDKFGQLFTVAHKIPVAGKDGPIVFPVPYTDVTIKDTGDIYVDGEYIDSLKITAYKSPKGLWGYQGTIFYELYPEEVERRKEEDFVYFIKQGFYEGSNEYPGMQSSKLHHPVYQGVEKTAKTIIKAYEKMFSAAGPE